MEIRALFALLNYYFQQSSLKVLGVDNQGKIAFVNPAMMEMIAQRSSEEKHITKVFPNIAGKYLEALNTLQPAVGGKFEINGEHLQGDIIPIVLGG